MKYNAPLLLLFLSACATPHVVDIVQPNDEKLGCVGLQNEVDELEQFIEDMFDTMEKVELSLGIALSSTSLN